MNDEHVLLEDHDDKGSADTRMGELKKKNPSAQYSVIQGRKSGKWHVVRHTSGGMSMAENVETQKFEDFLVEAVIHVSHDAYKRSHLTNARGHGHWVVGIGTHNIDFSKHEEGKHYIQHNGQASDAIKKAKEAAKKHGAHTVHMLP